MEQNKRNIYIITGAVIIIAVAFFVWKSRAQAPATVDDFSTKATTTVSTTNSSLSLSSLSGKGALQNNSVSNNGVSTNTNGISVIPPDSGNTNAIAPALDRPLPDTSKLDPQLVARTLEGMQINIAHIKSDKTSFGDWIDLGFARKTLGDYAGAVEIWNYVGELYPGNAITFGNLGDLYTTYIKDYTKAEANYLRAITNSPANIDLYRNLFNLYQVQGKNMEAVALLEKGIAIKKTLPDLAILLAHYYRDAGNTTQAKVYYAKAISSAQSLGMTTLVGTLKQEEGLLK